MNDVISIGVDPGLNGALAVLVGTRLHEIVDMPTMLLKGKRRQVNAALVAAIIRTWQMDLPTGDWTGYLERVSAMPGQGVSGVFSFGDSYGVARACLAILGIPTVLVAPVTWKKRAGLIKQPKDMARTLAIQLYPLAALSRKKDIGRAEAILIARFGGER